MMETLTSLIRTNGRMITATEEVTNKSLLPHLSILTWAQMRGEQLRGDIQWDADLNMINGRPGLKFPSNSCSQSAPDRRTLKVPCAITANTLCLFVPKAQEGRCLGSDQANITKYRFRDHICSRTAVWHHYTSADSRLCLCDVL